VIPPSAARSATGTNLLADSDLEEPTHVREPGTVTPSLTFPDSEPIASVTLEADAEPPAVSARILLSAPQPRRGLALVGLAMGLAIVGVAVAGVKLLGGRKATPASVSTQAAAAPADAPPLIAAIEPTSAPPIAKAAPPPAKAKAAPATPPPAKAKAAPATPPPAKAKAVPATIAHVAAPPRVSAPVEDRRATGRHGGKKNQRHAARARKVAMKAPAAKRNATTTTTAATPERGDPRPHYERGNALLFAGDSKGAIAAYRDAIRAAPADPSAFRGLGLAYEQQSEPVFAARALRRYLKLAPNAPDREIVARRLERLSNKKRH